MTDGSLKANGNEIKTQDGLTREDLEKLIRDSFTALMFRRYDCEDSSVEEQGDDLLCIFVPYSERDYCFYLSYVYDFGLLRDFLGDDFRGGVEFILLSKDSDFMERHGFSKTLYAAAESELDLSYEDYIFKLDINDLAERGYLAQYPLEERAHRKHVLKKVLLVLAVLLNVVLLFMTLIMGGVLKNAPFVFHLFMFLGLLLALNLFKRVKGFIKYEDEHYLDSYIARFYLLNLGGEVREDASSGKILKLAQVYDSLATYIVTMGCEDVELGIFAKNRRQYKKICKALDLEFKEKSDTAKQEGAKDADLRHARITFKRISFKRFHRMTLMSNKGHSEKDVAYVVFS